MAKEKKRSKAVYFVGAGMPLHKARRFMGLPIIAHTGRVNAHARCVGTKVKRANVHSRSAAQAAFTQAATGGCKG